jgi:hypothetical protein
MRCTLVAPGTLTAIMDPVAVYPAKSSASRDISVGRGGSPTARCSDARQTKKGGEEGPVSADREGESAGRYRHQGAASVRIYLLWLLVCLANPVLVSMRLL